MRVIRSSGSNLKSMASNSWLLGFLGSVLARIVHVCYQLFMVTDPLSQW
jgi:hypothetical protein